jgi:hypothetical protein
VSRKICQSSVVSCQLPRRGRRPPVGSTAATLRVPETLAERGVVRCGAGEETSGRAHGGVGDPRRTRSRSLPGGVMAGRFRSRERMG